MNSLYYAVLGQTGYAVTVVQQRLAALNYEVGAIDGIFGKRTETAVKAFQLVKGLLPTGEVDQPTMDALGVQALSRVPPSFPGGYSVRLGDIYHLDAVNDFGQAATELVGMSHKASDGAHFVDDKCAPRRPLIKKAGMLFAAYSFFHPDVNPVQQANLFCDVIGKMEPGDLPPELDFEVTGGLSAKEQAASIKAFRQRVKERLGMLPTTYTTKSMLAAIAPYIDLSDAMIWLASPGVEPKQHWDMWQYQFGESGAHRESIPGIPGYIDLSYWRGTEAEIRALAVK